ncbi:MAG: LysM peptidoglycan-binding domain-containing protein, partial [Anaerolineae bacterium]|nr:LysM peptidoglycan-binding domain-containing protein [Anaerolineae bacterium]
EQLLFRYSSALERGDFETVADVLRQAERDPALEQMILDMNDALSAERFNHANPKENPMIAALYQNRKPARSRANWQGLPFVAALAVIALLSVLLAVQTRGNIPVNSGGNNPPAAVAQINPYCTGTLISTFATVPLHSRPGADAPVVAELQHDNNAGREIVVLDRVSAESEMWVFVRVLSSPDVPFGWLTEAQFSTLVADCQPMVVPVEAVVQASATATPVPGIAQHPLLIVTLPSADVQVTVITATPVPFVIVPSLLPPTVVPPAPDAAAGEPFMPFYVQPGDTLISVLQRFNISLDRIPELMRINNLTDNSFVTGSAELSPGTILLLPVPNLGSLLICTLQDGEQVDVLTEDSEFAEVVMTLQAGDSLDVFAEPIGDWYAAVVHYDGATMSSVYVRIDAVEPLSGCQPLAPGGTSSMDALATPIPATLVPRITTTPPPTPTLAP